MSQLGHHVPEDVGTPVHPMKDNFTDRESRRVIQRLRMTLLPSCRVNGVARLIQMRSLNAPRILRLVAKTPLMATLNNGFVFETLLIIVASDVLARLLSCSLRSIMWKAESCEWTAVVMPSPPGARPLVIIEDK